MSPSCSRRLMSTAGEAAATSAVPGVPSVTFLLLQLLPRCARRARSLLGLLRSLASRYALGLLPLDSRRAVGPVRRGRVRTGARSRARALSRAGRLGPARAPLLQLLVRDAAGCRHPPDHVQ